MLKIFLCDDDPDFLSLQKDLLNHICIKNKLNAAVAGLTSSAGELLQLIEHNPGACLLFLDIDFGRNASNGIDIAARLKSSGAAARVVFTTNHYEMAMQVLQSGTEPFGFLEKSTDVRQLAAGLHRYVAMALRLVREKEENGVSIRLKTGVGETAILRPVDILYLEAEKTVSHGITYHTVNGSVITVISTLDAEAAKLGDGFLRVHRSFLAARSHMLRLREGYIVLSDQSEIPCSFRMRAEVKKWLSKE